MRETLTVVIILLLAILVVFIWAKKRNKKELMDTLHDNSPQFRLLSALKKLDSHVRKTDALDETMISNIIFTILVNFFEKEDSKLYKKYHLNPYAYFEIYCYLHAMGDVFIEKQLLDSKISSSMAEQMQTYLKYPLQIFEYILGTDVGPYFTVRLLEYKGTILTNDKRQGEKSKKDKLSELLVQRISVTAMNRLFVFKEYRPSLDLEDCIHLPVKVSVFQECTLKAYLESLAKFIKLLDKEE